MPLGMSPSNVRVVDPILTTVAQKYSNQEFIWNMIAPVVETPVTGGQIIQFDRTNFRTYNSYRTPGGATKRIQTGYEGKAFAVVHDALEHPIPDEHKADANFIGINWPQIAISACMDGLSMNLENEVATMATTLANYNSNVRVTLSGTDQWSDISSKIGSLIRAGQEAVRAQVGTYPNVWWMGAQVFSKVAEHPLVLDKIKYTSKDSVTPEMLAGLFGFAKVVVGSAVKASDNATAAMSDIWGKDSGLCYIPPETLNGGRLPFRMGGQVNRFYPSTFYTYTLTGNPFAKPMYRDNNSDSDIYGAKFSRTPVKVGANSSAEIIAGYLFKSAVA